MNRYGIQRQSKCISSSIKGKMNTYFLKAYVVIRDFLSSFLTGKGQSQVLALAFLVQFGIKGNAQNNHAIASRVDSIITNLQNQNKFSGAVLLAQSGNEILLKNAYGYSDRSNSIENKTSTQFALASLGKIFTSTAILKLIEERKIDLDDPLKKFDFKFKDLRAEDITIRQLLAHTSGFGHYWENEEYLARKLDLESLQDYMDFIRLIPLDAAPGEEYQYSNVGYIILGKVIESVTGNTYYGHIKETIFKPLGMKSSNYNYSSELTSNFAKRYGRSDAGRLIEIQQNLSPRGASDGGGYSTITDLSVLSNAIFYDGFLSNESISLLCSNYESEHLDRSDWTFDLVGGAPGVSTALGFHGPSGFSMIVLSNMDSPASETVVLETLGIITEELSRPAEQQRREIEEYNIHGSVLDSNTNRVIPYVNIGIKNMGIGTASAENGSYNLQVPLALGEEDITFSALGYAEENFPVSDLYERNGSEIRLSEKIEMLNEVILVSNKSKIVKSGYNTIGLFSSGAYIGGRSPGATLLTRIEIPSENARLRKVYVHVRDNDKNENFKLRVRIIQVGNDGKPRKDIFEKSVIAESDIAQGWISFDLDTFNLVFEHDIYMGVEWIEEFDKHLSMKDAYPRISYTSSKNAVSYARTTSLNSWKTIPIKPNIYAEFITR